MVSNVGQVKILGELSEISGKKDGLVINNEAKTPIAEQFRYVRTSYCMLEKNTANQVILITSTISGEGKTFFALNFAKALAMIGKKVAVLSFDLRKPQPNKDLFDLTKPSLSDFLGDKNMTIDEMLDGGLISYGYTFFQSGNIPANPSELMMSGRCKELFYHLRESYDYVIVDSAPVGQVADAFSLTPFIDSTIYMMRYNWTTKQEVEFFQQLNAESKLKNPMVVINGSKVGQGYSYGYYQYS